MQLISPTDSLFLIGESREHPMHVGCLQLFEPPPGSDVDYMRNTYEAMVEHTEVQSTFRKHPAFFGGVTNVAWTEERDVELDYHLRRSALPSPGRVRDLLELTSRLHGSLLDRHRPLWETHLIEGLEDGRFAVYIKFHHSLIDGASASKLLQRTLTTDPDDREIRVPWDLPLRGGKREPEGPSSWVQTLGNSVRSVASLGPSTVSLARAALLQQQLTLPFRAPKTMFNVRIGGARRVAAQSWGFDRIKKVKDAAGVTVNDVVLAMCAGALRTYLSEQDALPDTPLIAMVPVDLRKENDGEGGNLVGTVLANLATDIEDAGTRLDAISTSMRDNKEVFAQLPRVQQLALSAFLVGGLALGLLPGFVSTAPPPFNLVISNVPGPRESTYFNGSRLDGNYPLSIALDGQALNITLANRGDQLDFGVVGCRQSVPHLQRILGHLETALKDLERATGV